MANLWSELKQNLNFFRIHLLFFTFTPFIFSIIFYASNGQTHVAYIDALYNCASALVVCGLATVDLSGLTGFQQALLFVQSAIGSPVVVSWVMVYIRRRYFAKRFEHIVAAELEKRKAEIEQGSKEGSIRPSIGHRLSRVFTSQGHLDPVPESSSDVRSVSEKDKYGTKRFGFFNKKALRKLRPEMIRRMDDAPKPVDPNGWISEEPATAPPPRSRAASISVAELQEKHPEENTSSHAPDDAASDTDADVTAPNGLGAPIIGRSSTLQNGNTKTGVPLGHTLTVEFRTPDRDIRGRRLSRDQRTFFASHALSQRPESPSGSRRHASMVDIVHDDRDYTPQAGIPLARRYTTQQSHRSFKSSQHDQKSSKNTGYGGFPYPTSLALRLLKKVFPGLERRLVRTITLPRTQTISTMPGRNADESSRSVTYISFEAIVGRNSQFHLLTEEHLEELGGVEYRALTALLWIVAGYYFGMQLIGFIIVAPYMSISRWRSDFEPPNLHRYIPPTWFSAFQIVSAFTNTGMSLVDQSMIPFQEAYPLIFVLVVLILGGNTAFPVFLRFSIWCITKCVPSRSRLNETLHFLLDHPRRCFIYLFPSHQTWFLLTVVAMLMFTDWFFFLVLDIGNATMEAIPIGVRFAIGLLQAAAVRAAGFATVPLSNLAPAVQTLFVMMMYVSVYPVAMSVRSTNVYEEKSLGVFDNGSDDDLEPSTDGTGTAVWGRYLTWHARRQLAFDMWWICLALFLLCIIERSKIQNEDNYKWFTIFTLIFELISAYGAVGLSLGVPYANFSFSGALTPLSKLIIIAVMIRGRHRGLPSAIDRAVMLPEEFKKAMGMEEDIEQPKPAGTSSRILEDNDSGHVHTNLRSRLTDSPLDDAPTPRASHESRQSQS